MDATTHLGSILRLFRPAPAAPALNPADIQANYRAWRRRILITSIVGYATYYFVRKNLSIAMPVMERELHLTKAGLGLFLTLHGVLYGVSKFANGFLGDRCNAPVFMATGLLGSALLNFGFGLSSTAAAFGWFWLLNGWFQGMGYPPCARLLTHWFPPHRLATKMAIWNISHGLGAGIIIVAGGYLAAQNWRLCFLVPACFALLCAVFLWRLLPDTPPSVGLPEVEGTFSVAERQPTNPNENTRGPALPTSCSALFKTVLLENVFRNKYVWLVALANFFVYAIRYAVLDWAPTLLTQAKHIQLTHAGWMTAAFEGAGIIGALAAGRITDLFFKGRAARACVFFMAFSALSLLLFWKNPSRSELLNTVLLCCAGFCIYGPQLLVAVVAANLATKHAAASAVGLTGLFGYLSTVLSGWGLGRLVDAQGWDAAFLGLLVAAGIGLVLFGAAWGAAADGYKPGSG